MYTIYLYMCVFIYMGADEVVNRLYREESLLRDENERIDLEGYIID